jgi:hypothetical protein
LGFQLGNAAVCLVRAGAAEVASEARAELLAARGWIDAVLDDGEEVDGVDTVDGVDQLAWGQRGASEGKAVSEKAARSPRVCVQCGKEKGVTAFPKGQTGDAVCRACLGPVVQKEKKKGGSTKGGSPFVAPALGRKARKRCLVCDERKDLKAFPKGGEVCGECSGV